MTLSRIIRCQYGKWALYRLPTIFANFAAWRKGLALARRCRPPFSNFIFTCRVLCKRRKLGFTWWRHIKQSQISCHWWQRLCSSAQPYGDTYGCAPDQHSSSWVSKVLFPTNDENEVWATAGEREKFIFFVCTKYIWLTVQFIAEDNAFSQPYGVTTLHLKEGRHTWVSSYPFTSFSKGQLLKSNF